MSGTSPKHAVEFILDLFARQGATEYMGEAVTMSQHMEQTAPQSNRMCYHGRLDSMEQ